MDFTSGSGGELGTRGTADRLASNRRTARPDGRAFLRPLGAGSPRGGALRGSSALAPGLGLVAASVWARPFGRAVNGPGLGPALPTRRPRGLALQKVRWGKVAPVRALWARPSRPQRPAGRYPCPPWAAWAPPAPPACGGRGNVAAVAACGGSGQAAACRCSGAPFRKARPSPCGAALRALLCSSPSPVAA